MEIEVYNDFIGYGTLGNIEMKLCVIEDCSKPQVCRGWCRKHYYHWQKYGDPNGKHISETLEERFWAKVDKNGPQIEGMASCCWLWTAGTNGKYGKFWDGNKKESAHKIAYKLLIGPILKNLELDHLCAIKLCVNPEHLEAVTHAINIQRHYDGKTHCINGHPYEGPGSDSYIRRNGTRQCRHCAREWYQRKKKVGE